MQPPSDQPSNHDWVAFLQRPTFSLVLSGLLLVTGLIAWRQLPLREYPKVAIPVISVTTHYPQASYELVERDVTLALEEPLASTPGLESLQAESWFSHSSITLHFRPGTSVDRALLDVRERLAWARLPREAKQPVVRQRGNDSRFHVFMRLAVRNNHVSSPQLAHQTRLHLESGLQTIPGVAGTDVFGPKYRMEIRLDATKLAARGVDVGRVLDALRAYRVSLPAGWRGNAVPITVELGLNTPQDFAAIPLKSRSQHPVTLGDVARIQVVGKKDSMWIRVDGEPAAAVHVFVSEDSNRIAVGKAVRRMLPRLQQRLPTGSRIDVLFDGSMPVQASLDGVKKAVAESVVLVVVILLLFLRSVSVALVPVVVIPLSLVSTAFLLHLCGFSLNVLSLLGMALAVGIVVDDAIVVAENIHRHVTSGLSPKQAALKSGRELGFAIVGITLTLVSVYAPVGLVPDIMGQLFQEFALALAGAVLVSGVLALTLSPMMSAYFMKAPHANRLPAVERGVNRLDEAYARLTTYSMGHTPIAVLTLTGLSVLLVSCLWLLPRQTLPHEDRDHLGAWMSRIPGVPLREFDKRYVKSVESILRQVPEMQHVVTAVFSDGAWMPCLLKPSQSRARSDQDIKTDLQGQLAVLPSVQPNVWSSGSSLPGMQGGSRGQDTVLVVKTSHASYTRLHRHLERLTQLLQKQDGVQEASHDVTLSKPALSAVVDQAAMAAFGLEPPQVAAALRVFFDKDTPFDWRKDGLTYPVEVRMQHPARYLEEIHVTTKQGDTVPLAGVVRLQETVQPDGGLERQDQMRAGRVNIQIAPGHTMQEVMRVTEQVARDQLPDGFVVEWDQSARRQEQALATMWLLFALAVVFIYGSLAVLFNSFLDPLVILFTVPLACGGALGLMGGLGMQLNVFSYLGLITLVGLITKHGILLVEFGGQLLRQGLDPLQAARQAAKQRLRPIVMTALSTAVGHAPLLWATGAGAAARRAIGVVLVGGMVTGTVLTLLVIPTLWAWARQHVATSPRRRYCGACGGA